MRPSHFRYTALILGCLATWPTIAADTPAPIDRVKLTDGSLTCPQIQDEVKQMEGIVTEAQASQSSGQTKNTAGAAAGVAADVASRTGIFGALGGLGGHLFGSVASKAAAQSVEQQGATDAAQAAERQKQAQARKEYLSQLYLSKSCGSTDAKAAAAAQASLTTQAAPAASTAPPPTFGTPKLTVIYGERLKGIKRVAVASFTVQFVDSQIGEVTTQHNLGSGGGMLNTYQLSSRVVGTDFKDALARDRMQDTTNTLYQDFLSNLKSAGLDVVPPEKLLASENFKKFAARGATTPRVEDAEAQKSNGHGAIRSVFISPPGLPLVIKAAEGNEGVDWLNKGTSVFSPSEPDWTLTFTGRLGLSSTSFLWNEKDVQKEFDSATLHVRIFVPLAVIDVGQGARLDWTRAKIEPGVLLGNRFTRMTVGVNGDYSYIFLGEDFKVPGVIEYTVEEVPASNPLQAAVGVKRKLYPSTLYVDRYWRDVPEASRVVFKSLVKTLRDGQSPV